MTDVEDVIDYIRSLKKGFDKDEFKEKIEELAHTVDTVGLNYDEFHTLFKVWLNLCIPVTKWKSVGVCLVPRDRVETKTVEYAIRWLLANYQNQMSFSRIGFVLDWLTVAMDTDSIDMKSLDSFYTIFYMLLSYEIMTPHAIKLVYYLSKPMDVTRQRVIELIDLLKKRDVKKSKCRQIEALLGLFKSYKPECVPENVPSFSIHTVFRKPNMHLQQRFGKCQVERNNTNDEKKTFMWINPSNTKSGSRTVPLVPNIQFDNVGSKQYTDKKNQKNFFDFNEPAALLEYSLRHELSRPARLRALLCNETAATLLATAPDAVHAFFSHDLHHLLDTCFLGSSPYSYKEKCDLLRRLGRFQRTLLQGLPVITGFLANYMPLWNEKDYFHEILELVEWLSIETPSHLPSILRPLGAAYHRAQPLQQCAILNSLTNLYVNLTYSSKREKQHFMSIPQPQYYDKFLTSLAQFLADTCSKALQVSPEDARPLYSGWWSWEGVVRCHVRRGESPSVPLPLPLPLAPPPPPPLLVALSLCGPSAALLDKLALNMLAYKKIFDIMRKEAGATSRQMEDQLWQLQAYTTDMISALWGEQVLSERQSGLLFSKLHPQLVEHLSKNIPDADSALSLRSHVAFAPYSYTQVEGLDDSSQVKRLDNKFMFETVVAPEFPYLSRFLTKILPELRN